MALLPDFGYASPVTAVYGEYDDPGALDEEEEKEEEEGIRQGNSDEEEEEEEEGE